MAEKSIYLFMTEGSADKEYHLHLRRQGAGWCAWYANGRRGKVSQVKPIKEGEFSLDEALKHYEDKLKAKLKDGYTEAESGVRFTNTEVGKRASGHAQQLPSPVDRARAEQLIADDRFAMQEKANGERCSIEVRNGIARGINKLGLYRNLPENVAQEMAAFGDAFVDGELVGSTYYVFDLLDYRGQDLRARGFGERYAILDEDVLSGMYSAPTSCLRLLQASFTADGKREKLARVEDAIKEGVVFKDAGAPYEGGRSETVFKFKLVESSSCLVARQNDKRSVGLYLLDAQSRQVPVGNVTIPGDQPVPEVGAVVEVQYLYYNPGGAFEQSVYLGERNDVLPGEALLSQVTRIKPADSGESDADSEVTSVRERSRG